VNKIPSRPRCVLLPRNERLAQGIEGRTIEVVNVLIKGKIISILFTTKLDQKGTKDTFGLYFSMQSMETIFIKPFPHHNILDYRNVVIQFRYIVFNLDMMCSLKLIPPFSR
jgi:hypothetical protein